MNNREIKFRAWDKDYREYREVNELNELVRLEYPNLRSVYTHPSNVRGDVRYKELYERRVKLLEHKEHLEEVMRGKMHYDVNISSSGKVMALEGGWDYQSDLDWKLMQFTGLKDKNGKEIYEGDILLDDTEGQEYDFVEWSEYYAGWTTGQWFGSEELAREAENLEVIGDIYSNPELTKSLNQD